MTLGLHQQKCKMLKIITLLLLVGDLGLRVLWFYLKTFFFFFYKFKSLKCTVILRLLYSWVAVDCLFVWCLQHSGWSWNKGYVEKKKIQCPKPKTPLFTFSTFSSPIFPKDCKIFPLDINIFVIFL